MQKSVSFARLDIVIVDDHKGTRDLLKSTLRALGVTTIREASESTQAYKEITRDPPDLVILDHHMPSVTGEMLARALKTSKREQVRDVTILMLTGRPTRQIVRSAKQVGVAEVMAKPFSPARLKTAMMAALANEKSANSHHADTADTAEADDGDAFLL